MSILFKWGPQTIEWLVDGKLIRKEERKPDEAWPEKPMFLYSSVWDASYIDEGRWTGNYVGKILALKKNELNGVSHE
jgi:beta-glucanase (GH16 family)